jgi:aminoglycoside phosphotransferase family enzyme/predicted kinase
MTESTLINSLQNDKIFAHETQEFNVLETHISWVLLTGDYAYKIKKPVNFGFLDFTSVEKRRHFCQLELDLNKRLAPDLYLEAVPIFGTPESPSFEAKGEPFDYAIKMRQFKQENLLLEQAREHKLKDVSIQDIARQLAIFHRKAKIVKQDEEFGSPQAIFAPVADNFNTLRSFKIANQFSDDIDKIAKWAKDSFSELEPLLSERKANGFIRACHGDVHLGNIVLYSAKPLIFDCIEFNEEFRHTDTINDIAFLAMDLIHKGYKRQANLLINTYAEWSNDYQGLTLIPFYMSYRAMVRAKVSALQIDSFDKDHPTYKQLKQDLADFIALAKEFTKPKQAKLSLTFGPSGSGKSVYSKQYMMEKDAIRLRSDVIRKHLFGLPPFKATPTEMNAKMYSKEATEDTFATLVTNTTKLLKQNWPVVVDATFLKKSQRDRFTTLSKSLNVPIEILQFEITVDELKANIEKRKQAKLNPSDANVDVMLKQLDEIEPLSPEEQKIAVRIDHQELLEFIS